MDFRSTRIWQWATVLVVALTLGILTAGAIYLAAGNNDLRADLKAERADVRAATANAEKLYQQLLEEGIKPAAEKPAEVEAAPGQNGETGPRGFTGDQGPRGDTGPTGVAGLLGATGGVGSAGLNGSSGADGTAGSTGADGSTGPAGATGSDGTVGAAGQPPMSWTFTTTPGGDQTCTRTDPFDPASPTYSCTPTPAP